MPSTSTVSAHTGVGAYTGSIAHTQEQIAGAQRLRHQVFSAELGIELPGELDTDPFDEFCDHLIVTHTVTNEIVGTYRLRPPGRGDSGDSATSSRLYSEGEFDLSELAPMRGSLIEAGRSCVHPDHRSGAVITLMWAAMARYALLSGHRYLAGCASVPLGDGGAAAANMCALMPKHSVPGGLRVRPHVPWLPAQELPRTPSYARLPPLLRGYLRLGAQVCGPPAYDAEFGVADFFVLLRLDRMDERYLRRFAILDDEANRR